MRSGMDGMMAPVWLWTIIGALLIVLLVVLILKLWKHGSRLVVRHERRSMNKEAVRVTALVLTLVLAAACSTETGERSAPTGSPQARGRVDGPTATGGRRIEIAVTEQGFRPEKVSVAANEPVTLVFTRTTDNTCAKEVILQVDENNRIEKQLPLRQPVEVALTLPKPGELRYVCGMNMLAGVISIE